jgi:FkbM family methyltransferase
MMIWREIFDDRSYRDAVDAAPSGATIFDVGAHTGLAALYFTRNINNPRIFSFEPASELYKCLNVNLDRHVRAARAIPLALGNKNTVSRFTYYPDAPSQSGLFADWAGDRQATVAYLVNQGATFDDAKFLSNEIHTPRGEVVTVATLSSVLADMDIGTVDLLKLDVERSEFAVLKGITDSDWPRIKSIVMEVHDDGGRLSKCVKLLERQSYALTVTQAPWLKDSELYNVFAVRQ